MTNTKLVQLLLTFTNLEYKWFDQYIRSPYHNENPLLADLLGYIRDSLQAKSPQQPEKEEAFGILFPNQAFNDLKIRHLISDLLRLLEGFLINESLKSSNISSRLQLLKELRSRNQNKHFEAVFNNARGLQHKQPYRNAAYFYHEYALEAEYSSFLALQQSRLFETNLQQTVDNLDVFYLIEKLRYGCIFHNYKNVLAVDYQSLLMDEILEHIRQQNYDHVPAVSIYYSIYMTLTESDDELHYRDLKSLLLRHIDQFTHEEAREMYAFANNYCIKQINLGHNQYLNEIFANYQTLLQKEIIIENGSISPWDYKNIVVTGLRLNEFTWVEDFIYRYKHKLEVRFRENAFIYNLAYYHFYRNDYDRVMDLLQQVEFEDVFYSLDSKAMLLKTYYELHEVESLLSLFDSFTIFLKRNKVISDRHRHTYLNLIRFVKKLSRIPPGDHKKIEALQQEIEGSKGVADLNWLREKIRELSP